MALIRGSKLKNFLNGTEDDDLLAGLGGDDTLVGGKGNDTAWYSGDLAGYSFANEGGRLIVRDIAPADGSEGTDTLAQIELLQVGTAQLSLSPSAIRANTFNGYVYLPAVTGLIDGGFVECWTSQGQDGDSDGVFAQRYNVDGQAEGAEFQVNTYTPYYQSGARVTALNDGGFVISWTSYSQENNGNDGSGVYGQRYDASGSRVGAEFHVNTYTTYDQNQASITTLSDGGLVVSWQSAGQDGDGAGIYAQRYDSTGTAAGAEFLVNYTTVGNQDAPVIAALADGGFVISWESDGQDGDGYGIFARRFDASGAATGSEFQVNTFTAGSQEAPVVATLADGHLVVSWSSNGQDGDGYGIYAQRYDSSGSVAGTEFRVNSYTTGNQTRSTIAALADGGFVVGWLSNGQDGNGIYVQRYDPSGVAVGTELRVNSEMIGGQARPALAALAEGGFVVSWQSGESSGGIYSQRYDGNGDPVGLKLTGTAGDDRINIGTGQTLTVDGAAGNDTISGSGGDDLLFGGAGVDVLSGNAGDDLLDGGVGADRLAGGPGDDTYRVDNIGDIAIEAVGEGNDSVESSVTWTLAANFENLTLTGGGNINGTGNSSGNLIDGNSGNNILDGGGGADILSGGSGNDTYVVDNAFDFVNELSAGGTDKVQSSVSFTLAANVENLELVGSGAINGFGNALANSIRGNAAANSLTGGLGNDTLDGGAGSDTLVGGAGNDTYIVDVAGDVVIEAAGEGSDQVNVAFTTTGTYVLRDNIENALVTSGVTVAVNLTGNASNNVLTGNAAANRLDGGIGADTLIGGLGNDIYVVDNVGDVVTETSTLISEIDGVQSSIDYLLGLNLENLTLTGTAIYGTGNDLANLINGDSGANFLSGGGGNDTLIGGLGNDTYYDDLKTVGLGAAAVAVLKDTIVEQDGVAGGVDTLFLSSHSGNTVATTLTLASNLENLNAGNTSNSLLNLTGNASPNTLTGNDADNRLDGGLGADTLIGGAGNDTYVVDNVLDVVTELSSGGTDKIQSSVSFTLAANVENLELVGSGAISGVGNALANSIRGNAAANSLTGGLGNDTLDGGAGSDTLIGGGGNDLLTGGLGADTFYFDLAPSVTNVDHLSDFASGIDHIFLSKVVFNTLGAGSALNAADFSTGTSFLNTDAHHMLYNTSNGNLYYNADGSASGAPVLVAVLDNHLTLSSTDFVLG